MLTITANHLLEFEKLSPYTLSCNDCVDFVIAKNENIKAKDAIKIKSTSPYPLFPKFGHHWSYYGECLVVDTIIKHIEKLHNCDLPNIVWNKIDVVDSARSRDADVLNSMKIIK